MTAYVIRRILWLIPVLWAVATITFILMHVVPGGPFDQEKQLPPAVVANLNAKYNLDKPVYQQYGLFFWDLGGGWPLAGELDRAGNPSQTPTMTRLRVGPAR